MFKRGNPDRAYTFKQSMSDGLGVRLWLNKHRPTRSPIFGIRSAMPVLDASINIEYRFVAPGLISRFRCEEPPVALVAAGPDHCVNARSAAQDFAHSQGYGAVLRSDMAASPPVEC